MVLQQDDSEIPKSVSGTRPQSPYNVCSSGDFGTPERLSLGIDALIRALLFLSNNNYIGLTFLF